jgi:foldase protein PrsA
MSEGNPVARNGGHDKSRFRAMIIIAGTAALVLVAGVSMQLFRSWNETRAADTGTRPGAGRTGLANPSVPKESAAKVTLGGRSIQISMKMLLRQCSKIHGDDVLDSIINRAIIQLACEGGGVIVTQVEVEREIVDIATSFKIPVETWLNMLTTERGITPEQYSRDVIWPMLALKKLAGSDVEITDQDMHRAFVRYYGARVKARMIMVESPRLANTIALQAQQSPDDFARLAMKHSIEPGSRGLGGSVPPIAKYSGNPTIENVAFRLKEGEISEIVQVGTTWVILKCEGFTEPIVQSIDEVRQQLRTDLTEEKVQEAVGKLFEQIKKDARIDNYWKGTTTGNIRQVSGQTRTPGVQPRAATSTSRPRNSVRSPSPTSTSPFPTSG